MDKTRIGHGLSTGQKTKISRDISSDGESHELNEEGGARVISQGHGFCCDYASSVWLGLGAQTSR